MLPDTGHVDAQLSTHVSPAMAWANSRASVILMTAARALSRYDDRTPIGSSHSCARWARPKYDELEALPLIVFPD
jgi:hypothetical protein